MLSRTGGMTGEHLFDRVTHYKYFTANILQPGIENMLLLRSTMTTGLPVSAD